VVVDISVRVIFKHNSAVDAHAKDAILQIFIGVIGMKFFKIKLNRKNLIKSGFVFFKSN